MKEEKSHIVELFKNEYFVQWIVTPSEESNHYWEKWITSHPDRKPDVERARYLISSASYMIDDRMPDEKYDSILQNIVNHGLAKRQRSLKPSYFPYWVAASLILIALIASWFVWQDNQHAATIQMITKQTLAGQKLTVNLPDGSTVMLNSESKISYPYNFNSKRDLTLEGEAFFNVAKDAQHPFTITSGEVKTKVVGTSFNVRAYHGDAEYSIAVVTGKVEVSDEHGNHGLLHPDMKGVFSKAKHQLLTSTYNSDMEIGWRDGILMFEEAELKEVLERLERWYGVTITVEDEKMLTGTYTGTYQNASLEAVLKGISLAINWDYVKNDKEIIIRKTK